jgi:2'-5' RNA ligase
MLLTVAFVPPLPVLDELNTIVDAAGWQPGDLERIESPDMQISVTAFGNVSRGDTVQVVSALTRISAGWPPAPELRFAGGTALEWPGDQTVWAKLAGGVDALEEVAQSISPAMLRLGFAVDRRRFRPWLPVGTVSATTELGFLERLLAGLESHQGETWQASHLSLLRTAFDAGRPGAQAFEVLKEFPLPAS